MKDVNHKDNILYDSIYRNCPEQAYPQRQISGCLTGEGIMGMITNGYIGTRFPFQSDENVLKSDHGDEYTTIYEYTKNHGIIHFLKGEFYGL